MTMYLRPVCANRCLWGVEGFQQIKIRHNSWAPEKFRNQILPALETYHNTDPMKLVNGVKAAKEPLSRLNSGKPEDRREKQKKFLLECGFSQKIAEAILDHEAPRHSRHHLDLGRQPEGHRLCPDASLSGQAPGARDRRGRSARSRDGGLILSSA
jgi:hypothetical protein